jgi:hypothetical protein
MRSRRYHAIAAGITIAALNTGCAGTHCGVYPREASSFPARPVSVAQAVEAAQPYLDTSFALRQAGRPEGSNDWGEPQVFVTLKRNQYHIVKENYPYIMARAYLAHAVKVDAETGVVTPAE